MSDTSFAKIGKTYKSKNEYLKSQDQFGDKLYVSYYDRLERRTYYIRNHEKADEIMAKWISKKSIKSTSIDEEAQLLEIDKVSIQKSQKSTSRNEESQLPITVDYNSRLKQETTAEDYVEDRVNHSDELTVPTQDTDADSGRDTGENPGKDMDLAKKIDRMTDKKVVELFNAMCPSLPKVQVVSNHRKKAIGRLLKFANGESHFLETLFHKVETSDFLCGRSGNWKAGFDWVIKQGNVIKIMEGNYDNYAASTGKAGRGHSLIDQLTSQAVQDFINN